MTIWRNITIIIFVLFLLCFPSIGGADGNSDQYLHDLAKDIVANLEKQVKQDELMVSLDILKTKKEKKIIPISRLLRKELQKVLDTSTKVTLPPFSAIKTQYLLTGFIRMRGKNAEIYTKIVDTKSGKKLASYKVKQIDTNKKSLFAEKFDDHLQKLVEDVKFNYIDQNFYIEEPEFKQKPEPKLGSYIRQTLGKMWLDYVNVFDEKKPFIGWTVKTVVDRVGDEYHLKMKLITSVEDQEYAVTAASIPGRLAPFNLMNATAKRFILVSKNNEGKYSKIERRHLETFNTLVAGSLSSQQIELIDKPSVSQAALDWVDQKNTDSLKGVAEYVLVVGFSVDTIEPEGDEVVGGIEGRLSLDVYDIVSANRKVRTVLKKEGTYIDDNEISDGVGRIVSKIKKELDDEIKRSFRNL
jgi:hypothetical protein